MPKSPDLLEFIPSSIEEQFVCCSETYYRMCGVAGKPFSTRDMKVGGHTNLPVVNFASLRPQGHKLNLENGSQTLGMSPNISNLVYL